MSGTRGCPDEAVQASSPGSELVWLTGREVAAILTYEDCIDVLEEAMAEVSLDKAVLPVRSVMRVSDEGFLGIMPGALACAPGMFGIKILSLYPHTAATGRSSHTGLFVLFAMDTGLPVAILSGGVLTAMRTAAASALATRLLARDDARVLTVIGTGEQARSHIDAVTLVRDISEVRIWGRNTERAEALAASYAGCKRWNPIVEPDLRSALAGSDIVCTVTGATDPLIRGEWLEPGMHLNVVGSGFPDKAEVDAECIRRSRVFVEHRQSALTQAGDLVRAFKAGTVKPDHVAGEIGEVVLKRKRGREGSGDITLYKSIGIAAQDLKVAWSVFERATRHGAGTLVGL